jgi:hypothetical protein
MSDIISNENTIDEQTLQQQIENFKNSLNNKIDVISDNNIYKNIELNNDNDIIVSSNFIMNFQNNNFKINYNSKNLIDFYDNNSLLNIILTMSSQKGIIKNIIDNDYHIMKCDIVNNNIIIAENIDNIFLPNGKCICSDFIVTFFIIVNNSDKNLKICRSGFNDSLNNKSLDYLNLPPFTHSKIHFIRNRYRTLEWFMTNVF